MSNLISMDKCYKTRDGQNVRLLCTDNTTGGVYLVVAIVEGAVHLYTADGKYYSNEDGSPMDLIEVAQEHSVWIELFKSNEDIVSCAYESEDEMFKSIQASKESATEYEYTLLATKKITVVEGEKI